MSDWFGRQPVKVVGGAGTTKDPRIVWLTHPPSELSRRLGNENVARSLGDYGYTHVWLRGCDHKTKTTKRAKMGTTTSVDDLHLTIYCRDEMGGNWHGHVYCVRERNGDWRIMNEGEKVHNGGPIIHLWKWDEESGTGSGGFNLQAR